MKSKMMLWCVVCLCFGAVARADVISLYDFEGPNPFDDKVSGATATVGSGVTIVSGTPFGNAAAFPDGTNPAINDDDIVVAQADAPVIGLNDFTVAAWVKRNTGSKIDGICDMVTGTTEGGFQLLFGDADFRLGVGGPGGVWMLYTSVKAVNDTAWHHLAVSVDRDNPTGLSIYIDGVLDSTGDPTGFASVSMAANQDYHIGSMNQNLLDGLLDELAIFNTALSAGEIQTVMKGIRLRPDLAVNPSPADTATDVRRDALLSWSSGESAAKHDVYFGTTFSDVNDADRANPANVLVSQAQDANTYDPPGVLDLGQTYYWRVDEVNAPPDSTVFKGDVWSFTVEPIAYPIAPNNITATASSSNKTEEGPENTIDGSGLDANDLHSTVNTDMWLSSIAGPQPTWIQYEFDKTYKLHQMWVWNYNSSVEPVIGFGIKEATIEYSLDGSNWTTLGTTHQFAQAPGEAGYAHNTTIDFGGVAAKYVRITANSNWGGIVNQYGLSEVRFFYVPVSVREPSPASGTTDVGVDTALNWRAEREAAKHNVYLSTDEQAVIDGTASVVTVTSPSYTPPLDLASTYYWRVDEVNEAETPTIWQGDVWNLSTQEYLVVDDFESYNDIETGQEGSHLVYETWIDGFGTTTNGSTIGYTQAYQPSMEKTVVYDGQQSVPLFYDNTTASYSEVTANVADLQVGHDWTKHGVKGLTLRFYGDPNNAPQQMYVKINDTKVLYDGDPQDLQRPSWQMWYIDLTSLGVDLSNVTKLTIGFQRIGTVGGQGMIFLDGIRLYSYDRQLITPAAPNSAGLTAQYEFEGTYNDSSGNNHTGVPAGIVSFVAGKVGQAASFGGREDYIEIPDYNGVSGVQSRTCSAWIKTAKEGEEILSWGQNVAGQKWVFRTDTNGAIRAEVNGGYIVGSTDVCDDNWHHVAVVFQTDDTPDVTDIKLYVDGVQETISAELSKAINTAIDGTVRIGKSPWSGSTFFFEGLIDDVRIYDHALSPPEAASLAGRTQPFDKPF
jgi:Concanavalin A-like lectin/glucanases superfamily/F5/8 type C domain